MTNKELDKWIAVNVMGWNEDYLIKNKHNVSKYTTDPAAAMEVLKKCLNKSLIEIVAIADGSYYISQSFEFHDEPIFINESTLELGICLFAKKLFSK